MDVRSSEHAPLPYAVVALTKDVAATLASSETKSFSSLFRDRRAPTTIRFGVGDILRISIFEAAPGGLYIPSENIARQGNYITLPDQSVDNGGNITVPYAGVIRAAGRTNVEIQNDIVGKLSARAIEPQAIVSLAEQRSNLVSVFGEVNAPIRFPAAYSGARDRITDAVTRAGGIKSQGFETWVTLERDKRRATISFENLINDASNNIFVAPGDQIYVFREPQRFMAFGAAGQQGVFPFDSWRLSLAEAVAKARGLIDAQADPASVYLYRREPRGVAERIGVDVAKFPPGEPVPIVYTISLNEPAGYFVATQTQMRHQDIIFVANAPSVELGKFLQVVNLVTGAAANTSLAKFYSSMSGWGRAVGQ